LILDKELSTNFLSEILIAEQLKLRGVVLACDEELYLPELSHLPTFRLSSLSSAVTSSRARVLLINGNFESVDKKLEIFEYAGENNVSVKAVSQTGDHHEQPRKLSVSSVTEIELLGRKEVPPDKALFSQNIANKTVLITGAGGSIGSELARQALSGCPKDLILLDVSEAALYQIEQELQATTTDLTNVQFILGSVQSKATLEKLFYKYQFDTVFHAAAYKHVPLVESNACEGLKNNVFGTLNIAKACADNNVSHALLVSTDKAVRPTNVMGASKRLCELIFQAYAAEKTGTNFSLVRFGNVLGSSGSVVPKFKQQIMSGGPITVTHPEITRYFMTIPEAASLVIQASAISKGGEVFLLDMGDPVKISDLAALLLRLSGYRQVMKNDTFVNLNDPLDIVQIRYSGLRPGEKLYEELLIDSESMATAHPRIFKAVEFSISSTDLERYLDQLKVESEENSPEGIKQFLERLPLSYKRAPTPDVSKPITSAPSISEKRQSVEDTPWRRESDDTINIGNLGLFRGFMIAILHRYFQTTRGLTTGVRCHITDNENKILLVKHTYVPGWHFPGGGIEKRETAIHALKREVFEETGLVIDPTKTKLIGIFHNSSVSKKDHIILYDYKVNFTQSLHHNKEIREAKFFPLHALPKDIEKGTLSRLDEITNGLTPRSAW
jgi:FlaA1/EpsC-like NDP-sugar epimerase/ADP-ribose pyrophosphatase YjhB (NUDIX family)